MSKVAENLMVKRMPDRLMRKLKKQAEKEQRTIKMVVIRALERYLDEAEGKK